MRRIQLNRIKNEDSKMFALVDQKVNLRPCTYSQNMLNSRKRKGCSSKFKGVSIDKHQGYVCYKTRVHINGRQIAQKRFPYTPEGEMMAAEFYNTQAKIHFGQFANLNKIQR